MADRARNSQRRKSAHSASAVKSSPTRSKSWKSFEDSLTTPEELGPRNILIFGPSGSGKTTFVGSAAFDERTSPILVLDFEGGGAALKGVPKDKLSYKRVYGWDDFNEAYDYLSQADHPFKSVAIDSITETHFFSLLTIVEQQVATNERRDDPTAIEQSDYGKSMAQMRRFLKAWKDLPIITFLTALTKQTTIPREGMVTVPNLFGQMSEEVVGMFDVTAFLSYETPRVKRGESLDESKIVRKLILQNTPGIRAKVRTGFYQEVPNEIILTREDGVTQLFDHIS